MVFLNTFNVFPVFPYIPVLKGIGLDVNTLHSIGDWMVSKWRLNGDRTVEFQSPFSQLNGVKKSGFQSHFSHHSVTIQLTELQAHFCDLSVNVIFEKSNYPRCGSNQDQRIKGNIHFPFSHRDCYFYWWIFGINVAYL